MEFIADLHIHSHFSRATSKMLIPEQIDYQSGIKGIKVVGTGDFTHPGWIGELKNKLEPEENGLFRLKKNFRRKPFSIDNETRFLLSAEISSIFKRDGKVRKVHTVILVQGFREAEKINTKLLNAGANLSSDGRPIIGTDCRDLLEIVLDCSETNLFIPAHIWTPWFSILGSKSGFDSPEECFGDLTPYIYAVETGLSTDAPMNWLCSFLDRFTLISNSDAHTPEKLGRNANIFNCDLSYESITNALKSGRSDQFSGTIDLYPQEGKYHFDGHRKCGICWSPVETIRNNGICPVCKNPVTVGVMNRIIQLSDRKNIYDRTTRHPFFSVIPLKELIGEILGTSENASQTENFYLQTIRKHGPELDILRKVPIEEIRSKSGEKLAEAIRRMRSREVILEEGYDGEYGRIRVFREGEAKNFSLENKLFRVFQNETAPAKIDLINVRIDDLQQIIKTYSRTDHPDRAAEPAERYNSGHPLTGLDPDQEAATKHTTGPSLILAGPGTGKTKTLTGKIALLINDKVGEPANILAITFTNKAALEMRERVLMLAGNKELAEQVSVSTFHSFGWDLLKKNPEVFGRTTKCTLIDESIRLRVIKNISGSFSEKTALQITNYKNRITPADDFPELYPEYEKTLRGLNVFDFDDLIAKPVLLFREKPELLHELQSRFRYIFIDEFQDTNLVQYELIRVLMPDPTGNLCVVGDPNQSVYSFRGASGKIVTHFLNDYPNAHVFMLRTSYRCPQSILNAASSVISRNDLMLRGLAPGLKINLTENATDKSEAEFIAREIEKLLGGVSFFSLDSSVTDGSSVSISEIAVLCRTKNQFPALIKAFNDHLIPYQVIGEEPFYREEPFLKLINLLQSAEVVEKENLSLFLKLNNPEVFPDEIEKFRESTAKMSIKESIQAAALQFMPDSGFNDSDFERFLQLAEQFKNLNDFLFNLRIGTGSDTIDKSGGKVLLMTIHASKGLEFSAVFIPGCEQGLIPYTLYQKKADIEEERRLFYVGMTRVKRILYLSRAKQRFIMNRKFSLPASDFLSAIEDELFTRSDSFRIMKKDQQSDQLKLF